MFWMVIFPFTLVNVTVNSLILYSLFNPDPEMSIGSVMSIALSESCGGSTADELVWLKLHVSEIFR